MFKWIYSVMFPEFANPPTVLKEGQSPFTQKMTGTCERCGCKIIAPKARCIDKYPNSHIAEYIAYCPTLGCGKKIKMNKLNGEEDV